MSLIQDINFIECYEKDVVEIEYNLWKYNNLEFFDLEYNPFEHYNLFLNNILNELYDLEIFNIHRTDHFYESMKIIRKILKYLNNIIIFLRTS